MANIIEQINIGGTVYSIAATAYAVSSLSASTAAKSVTIDGFNLISGVTIRVKFNEANTAADPTLTVSGVGSNANTAIPITGISTWSAGAVLSFTYDGTSWVHESIDNNITGSGASGSLAKFNGTNTITNGPALSSTISNLSLSTKFLREDGKWAAPSYTTNTDVSVTLTGVTTNGTFPILFKNTNDTTDETAGVKYGKTSNKLVTINPNTGAIAAPGGLTGNASTATQFSAGTTVKLTGDVTGESSSSKKGWTVSTTIGTGKVTNAMLAGSIDITKLNAYSITIGNTTKNLGERFDLSDLGIAAAMNFKGVTTTEMTDGRETAAITINGESYTPANGDVVLYDGKEYVWTGSAWEQLGDETSWALDSAVIHNTLTSAKGDIIYASAANKPARLAIGTLGQVLKVSSSGIPVWGTDNDTKVSQTLDSTSTSLLPLLFSLTAKTDSTATVTNTVKRNNSIYVQPSTGTLYATKFSGDGSALENVTAASVAWSNVEDKKFVGLYVNATSGGATSNATATNPYIHLYDNDALKATVQLKGAGGATVKSNDSKVITITSLKYKSSGSANALTSLKLKYNDGTAHDDSVSSATATPTALGTVTGAVLYIKSMYYGTTNVSTGVTTDS